MGAFLQVWEFLLQHGGDLASVGGFALALGTLIAALKARSAAKSAETAAQEARQAVTRTLRWVDAQRAIDEGWRLADAIRQGQFDVAAAVVPRILTVLNDLESATSGGQQHRDVRQLQNHLLAVLGNIDKHIANQQDVRSQSDIAGDVERAMPRLMRLANAFQPDQLGRREEP